MRLVWTVLTSPSVGLSILIDCDCYQFDDEVVVEHLVCGGVHGGVGTGHGLSVNRYLQWCLNHYNYFFTTFLQN